MTQYYFGNVEIVTGEINIFFNTNNTKFFETKEEAEEHVRELFIQMMEKDPGDEAIPIEPEYAGQCQRAYLKKCNINDTIENPMPWRDFFNKYVATWKDVLCFGNVMENFICDDGYVYAGVYEIENGSKPKP